MSGKHYPPSLYALILGTRQLQMHGEPWNTIHTNLCGHMTWSPGANTFTSVYNIYWLQSNLINDLNHVNNTMFIVNFHYFFRFFPWTRIVRVLDDMHFFALLCDHPNVSNKRCLILILEKQVMLQKEKAFYNVLICSPSPCTNEL